jgi:uncharacterized protein (TIGR02246 family)
VIVGDDPHRVAAAVLARLDAAWNLASGAEFAAAFAEDAQVVNVFGARIEGRAALADRMQFIFDGIFRGSTHRARTLEYTTEVTDGVVLAVSLAEVDVPTGPLAPMAISRQSLLVVRTAGGWPIVHWHNTPVRRDA